MANAAMAFHVLGYDWNDPDYRLTREAIDRLLFQRDADTVTCQPYLSPIWDTCLAAHAMLEAGEPGNSDRFTRAFDWLLAREITDVRGHCARRRAHAPIGGRPFPHNHATYPAIAPPAAPPRAMDH